MMPSLESWNDASASAAVQKNFNLVPLLLIHKHESILPSGTDFDDIELMGSKQLAQCAFSFHTQILLRHRPLHSPM